MEHVWRLLLSPVYFMSQQEMYKNPTKHLASLNSKFEIFFDKEAKFTAVQKKNTWKPSQIGASTDDRALKAQKGHHRMQLTNSYSHKVCSLQTHFKATCIR